MACGSLTDIIKRKLSGKKVPYSDELKKFAVTLQFYSSKAYTFVRKQFFDVLPHPRTLTKWYQGINGDPGFTKESFDILKLKVNENKIVISNLVIDEMSIKDKIEFDGKKFHGLVDLGTGADVDSDNVEHATYALVFLAVGVNGNWKLPLGYFLIKGLNESERANLLSTCLELVHETGVKMNSITFDGAHTNLSMCTKLGANFKLSSPKFYFPHPKNYEKPVFIFYDPCHMIKLIRNTLGDKNFLFNSKGEKIEWNFIKELYYKEKEEGLKTATKLSHKHIYYYNEKMNVRLATQLLSNSVSKGLLLCQSLDSKFKDSGPTAEFCQFMNDAFDILNCRSKYSKSPYNKALNLETYDNYVNFIKQFEEYVYGLKHEMGPELLIH